MPFPSSPVTGQQYTIGNVTWEWISAQGCWNLLDATNLSSTTTQVFTSSGTWTKPSNAQIIHVTLIGGGGAGRTATSSDSATGTGGVGGGGGALTSGFVNPSYLDASTTVTVGLGGASSNASGGTTTFNFLKAGGGIGFGSGLGGYGLFNGASGGGGGGVDGSGATSVWYTGTDSYGAAGGGYGGNAQNLYYDESGGAGGGSPVYSMVTGTSGTNGNSDMPIPGVSNNSWVGTVGAGGKGGAFTGTAFGGAVGYDGVVVIKTWYDS